ncbi:MAG: 16S rRNA (guanine(527)-N(7))-methyltransferase RsmG [Brachymonas sp.]|nr:16S rRNA (guanine(527)-N(7))-methyltransferase RsmG [Brachymonas sp.]
MSLLHNAAVQLGVALTDQQAQQLLAYRDRIAQWNRVYNLTSLRDPAQMLSHHIVDSLAAAPPLLRHLQSADLAEASVLDVGSGGGLPGVVLAILLPQVQVTCVDTVGKKAAFVQQVAGELRLKNLRGVHSRVEQMSPAGQAAPFDVITSRAFASLTDFVQLTHMHLKPQGVWMALKGKVPEDEIANLPASAQVFHVEQLQVPGLDAERCIVWMKPE